MTPEMEKSHLLYGLQPVETLVGHDQEGEKERTRERRERVRDSVWLRKGFDISREFDCWSNITELRDK
jgi:hypothetical protein